MCSSQGWDCQPPPLLWLRLWTITGGVGPHAVEDRLRLVLGPAPVHLGPQVVDELVAALVVIGPCVGMDDVLTAVP